MKKGINLLLTIATSLSGVALASCLTACPGGDEDTKPTSLKTTLKYLCENKNYSLTFYGTDKIPAHQIIYTENYMGRYSVADETMTHLLNSDEKGTYYLDFNQDSYVASEYKSDKNVWESGLFPTFYGQSEKWIKSIKDDATSVNVTDKNWKIILVQMMGYKSTDVLNLSDVTLSYTEANGLTIDANYNKLHYTYTVNRIGSTQSSIVTSYVKEGGTAYIASDALKTMRNGLRNNNYAQGVFNFGETEETTGYIANNYFNEHYYYTKYYLGTSYAGYISLNCPESTDPEDEHGELHGVYLFSVEDNQLHINPNFISNNPSIVEVMNYPSNLALLDNFQYLENWKAKYTGSYNLEGVGYSTTNTAILKDFSKNFNMDGSFPGQSPVAVSMDIVIEAGNLTKVTFYYTMSVAGVQYVYPIPFMNFGEISHAALDAAWEHYNYKLN